MGQKRGLIFGTRCTDRPLGLIAIELNIFSMQGESGVKLNFDSELLTDCMLNDFDEASVLHCHFFKLVS